MVLEQNQFEKILGDHSLALEQNQVVMILEHHSFA